MTGAGPSVSTTGPGVCKGAFGEQAANDKDRARSKLEVPSRVAQRVLTALFYGALVASATPEEP